MEREVKFRGKRIGTGEWVYGDLLHKAFTYIHGYDNGDVFVVVVDPTTVGQYTGLGDRDGSEIYEGDVLSDGAVVEYFTDLSWDSGGSQHPGFYCRKWMHAEELSYHDRLDGDVKVIGNIHQNPELLEPAQ